MISRELTVFNKLGLHARAAGSLVKVANGFTCKVTVEKEGKKVNSKSIMGLLMLAAAQGSRLLITTDGEDEGDAMEALEALFRLKFNEE
jgi:phosphocarrier protein HPr